MDEDIIEFFENAFKTISGAKKINYTETYGGIGKGAFKFGVYGDIGSITTLVRSYSGNQTSKGYRGKAKFSEMTPEAEISSLKLVTQIPSDDRFAKVKVATRVEGGRLVDNIETIQERINEALMTQQKARDLIIKNEEGIRDYCGLDLPTRSYGRETLETDSKKFSLIFDKKCKLQLTLSSGDILKASSEPEKLSEIIPALDFQIGKFEEVTKKF